MKKIILSLLFLATVLVALPQLFAAEDATGNLVIHFKAWDENYTELGSYGFEGLDGKTIYDSIDDFGAVFNYNNIPVVDAESTAQFGFIAVKRPGGGDPDWNNGKLTADIRIDKTVVKAGETVHIYVVQGNANSSKDDPRYFVADNSKFNMFLVYFDASGSYEENLGIHHWSGWDLPGSEWNVPVDVFTTGGNTASGSPVKVAMLSADQTVVDDVPTGNAPDAGFLIYFGQGDGSKKTGDVKLLSSLGENPVLGDVGFAYVYSAGNGVTTGDNVYYGNANYEDYALNAFSFRLLARTVDPISGAASGTFAVRDNQIIVKASSQLQNPHKLIAPNNELNLLLAKNDLSIDLEASKNYALPSEGLHDTTITWASDNETVINPTTGVVTRQATQTNVKLTATIAIGQENVSKEFNVVVPASSAVASNTFSLTVNVKVPETTPMTDDLYIVGSFPNSVIPSWTPDAPAGKLTRVDATNASITINFTELTATTNLEFKFTRGSWDFEQVQFDGSGVANIKYSISTLLASNTVEYTVEGWKDQDSTYVEAPDQPLYTEAEAKALVEGWFAIKPVVTAATETVPAVYGTALEIERVDYAIGNDTFADFVIVLKDGSKLDITKEYVLFFDNGLDTYEIDVDMDTEGPVITFPLLPASKIIEVEWGKPFNLADFPIYNATDNRDGDLTRAVFVPAGPNAILDTRTVGDYVIKLQVSDDWGNVTEETFTFRVIKLTA
ncbi:immunoglobulin-like domain-containing protein [Acholeplasma granularum]|uniref:immunoglobulin-like domain-containing protein n=1 Tax=Acholeplasma granularum TaxID=264635 RepID=UPI000472EE0E|nr:immunoglobulin-like domain-containing protein [Acholeplasma granularum]